MKPARRRTTRRQSRRIPTLSLFSGAGGMDLGFAAAGFSILGSIDTDPYSCRTIDLNSGKRSYLHRPAILCKDVCKLSGPDVLRAVGARSAEIEFVIGGPPCQAFSVFGRRGGLDDPRGSLVWEYLRIVQEIEPQAFVFENVAGLRSIHNGELYSELLEAMTCRGAYVVSDHIYELANFGIPQFRKRVFFIGSRGGKRIPPMAETHGPPDSLHCLLPWVTVGKVLSGMPGPGPRQPLANHVGRVHSGRIVQRYRDLRYGERDPRTRINKLHPDRPSFTIIVGSDAGGGKGHVHPYFPREVTPRESARLQTFPDWWEFAGTGRHVIRQVGNAVPPLFAALLGQQVAHYVFGTHLVTYGELVHRLGLDFLE